jgi:multidrug transporter EmrE-like cation transporter
MGVVRIGFNWKDSALIATEGTRLSDYTYKTGDLIVRTELVLLILLSVLLSSGSQVLLKFGMSAPAIQAALGSADGAVQIAIAIASSPWVLLGLSCFGLSAIVWLLVLSKIPLSTAYPFVALGIAITVVAGRFLFNEPITSAKLFGVSLIIVGVMSVSLSS